MKGTELEKVQLHGSRVAKTIKECQDIRALIEAKKSTQTRFSEGPKLLSSLLKTFGKNHQLLAWALETETPHSRPKGLHPQPSGSKPINPSPEPESARITARCAWLTLRSNRSNQTL